MNSHVSDRSWARPRFGRIKSKSAVFGPTMLAITLVATLLTAIVATPAADAAAPSVPTWRYSQLSVGATSVYAYWNEVDGADSYVITWRHNGSARASETTTAASNGNNYHRYGYAGLVGEICATVRARTGAEVGDWSTPRCFTAKPKPGVPTWQVPSITSASDTVTAKWNSVSGATRYSVYWTLPDGSKTNRLTSSTSFTLNTTGQGRYCAEVRASNSPQYSDKSPAACFTVGEAQASTVSVPPAPVMSSASLRRDSRNLQASWSAVPGADGVQISWSLNGQTFKTEEAGLTGMSLDYDELVGEICATARARNSSGYGPWSAPKCYTANPKPATPTWGSPAVAVSGSSTVEARWGAVAGATKYYVFLTKPDGTSTSRNTTSTSLRFSVSEPGQYCAKAMAFNGDRYSPRSAERCTDFEVKETLPTPEWASGVAKTNQDKAVRATFNVVPNATSYTSEFRHNGSLVDSVTGATGSLGVFSQTTDVNGRTGQWCARVRANGSGSSLSSAWTASRCVTVAAPVTTTTTTTTVAAPTLPAPVITSADLRYSSAHLKATWGAVDGADGYQITWTVDGDSYRTVPTTSTWAYLHFGDLVGEICGKVRAKNNAGYGAWSAEKCHTAKAKPATPTWATPGITEQQGRLTLSWNAVTGATNYVVWVTRPDGGQTSYGSRTTTASVSYTAEGRYCATVRASDGERYGLDSVSKCLTVGALQPPPAPIITDVSLLSSSMILRARWAAIAGADRYEIVWSSGGQNLKTRQTSFTTNDLNYAALVGEVCAKVRGENGSGYGPWSAPQCYTVKPKPAAPTWRNPAVISSPGQIQANWNPTVGATKYYVYWTHPDGYKTNRSTTETQQTRYSETPGRYCATVRAFNGEHYGPHSAERCTTMAAAEQLPYPTPAMRMDEANGVIGSWSSIPNVDFYLVEWTDDGVPFGPTSAVAVMNGSRVNIGEDRSGQICLKVKSRGSGDFSDSPWSPASCLEVATTRALRKPSLYPIFGTAPSVGVSWIAVENADSYNVKWTDDGVEFRSHTLTERRSLVELGSRSGEICATVQANGSGQHTDSIWSHQKCRTITLSRLATPVVSNPTVNDSDVVFSWGAVPDRADYEWAAIHPDGRVVRGTTKSTSHAVLIAGQHGNFCFEVRAVLTGRDSALSPRKCAVVQAPPQPPVVTPPRVVLPPMPPAPRVDTTPPNWQNNVAGINFGNVWVLPNSYDVPIIWNAALDFDDRDEFGVSNFKGVEFYEIYLNNDQVATVQGGNPRQHTFIGLSYGVRYTLKVRAVDDTGNKSSYAETTVEKISQAASLGLGDETITGSPESVPAPPPRGTTSPGSPSAGPAPVGPNFPTVPSGSGPSGPTNQESVTDQPSPVSAPIARPVQNVPGLCGAHSARVLDHDGVGKVRIRWDRAGTSDTDEFALQRKDANGRVVMTSGNVPAQAGGKLHEFILSNIPDAFLKGEYRYELVARKTGSGRRNEICATFRAHQITIRSHPAEDYIKDIAAEIGLTGGIPGNPWLTGTAGDVESMKLRDLTDQQATALVAAVKRRPSFHADLQAAEQQYKDDDLRYESYLYRMVPLQFMLGSVVLADELQRKGIVIQGAEALEIAVSTADFVNEARIRPNSGLLRADLLGVKLGLGFMALYMAKQDLSGIVGEVRAIDQSALNSAQDVVEIMGAAIGLYGLLALAGLVPGAHIVIIAIAIGLAILEAVLGDKGRFDYSYTERLSQVNDKKHAARTFALMTERKNLEDIQDKIDKWFFRSIPGSDLHLVSSRLLWHGSRTTDSAALSVWTAVEPVTNQTYGIGMAIHWNPSNTPGNVHASTVLNPGNHGANFFWEIGSTDNFSDIHNPDNKPLHFGNVKKAWSSVGSAILSHCASTAGPLSRELCDAARL